MIFLRMKTYQKRDVLLFTSEVVRYARGSYQPGEVHQCICAPVFQFFSPLMMNYGYT